MNYFSTENINGLTIVRFSFREISIDQREELKKELDQLLHEGHSKFIFNMKQIGYFTSLMITTTLFFAREISKRDGEIKLCELSDDAMDVVRLTRLDKVFEIYNNEERAIKSFV